MSYRPTYCEATHPDSIDGCFEAYEHTGQHRGYDGGEELYWSDDQPQEPLFSPPDLGVILMLLAPVKQFFPELQAKVEKALEDSK